MGPRRYLVDGYPRHKEDAEYFEKQLFVREIMIHKLIHIEVSVDRMRISGMEAKKGDKLT